MPFDLRPYQNDIVGRVRQHFRQGERKVLIQSPTGSGKTVLCAHILNGAAQLGNRSYFIVHRRELIRQSARTFAAMGIRHGVIAAGEVEDPEALVQICSIQTLARRWQKIVPPQLLVFDECHHVAAGSWASLYREWGDAFKIGLTATPERLDGKGLIDFFNVMVEGPPVRWLIDNGSLSEYRIFAPPGIDVSGVKKERGDWQKKGLAEVVDRPSITGDAIKHYQRHCMGKRALLFAVLIEHSEHVVAQFNKAGIPAEHVDGNTKKDVRDAAIKRLDSGDTLLLSNVDLFGEGFDLPSIEAGIFLRHTQSICLYLQQCGRIFRPSPGKKVATILDHVGNVERHGLPDDERKWSLLGREDRKKREAEETGPQVRMCPKCYCAQHAYLLACKQCGWVFVVGGKEFEQDDGELEEIDVAKIRRDKKREQAEARTFDDLVKLGESRKYPNPKGWARNLIKAREAKARKQRMLI